ncbi:MAG: Mrp/NBP35 family ATP-binding protein [Candidatus Rokubacteria bacterium]|nr:Mrp/NBP35 family ATP-binding protein [Candidatus Rokubacteria bacterium]
MTTTPGATVTPDLVLEALRTIIEPGEGRDIVSLGLIRDLAIRPSPEGAEVLFTLAFSGQSPATKAALHSAASKTVSRLPGVRKAQVGMGSGAGSRPSPAAPKPSAEFIPEVKHTVAVSSGKGGVGKSTVAVNLALALRRRGLEVGLVDVDVYGPDVPLMMGAKGRPGMFNNKIIPVEAHGVKMMSIGLLVEEREALVWRGPMIHSAVQQFLRDVLWGPLDYLVFDMPPGTGDAQLSLSQVIPLGGVVMVTTPQDVALLDVRKALGMFRKLNVPIIGVVENMSYFVAPDTGARYFIFGEGGGERVASEFGVPVLGHIPLEMDTRRGGDTGVPIIVGQPDSAQARAFAAVAETVVSRVDTLAALQQLPTIE